jgi:hypothetical protein
MLSPGLRCTAFAGHRRVAAGELRHVALKAKQAHDLSGAPVLVFDDASGRQLDLPLELPAAELRYLGPDLQPLFEAGEVDVLVGPSAEQTGLLRQTIELC